MAVKISPEKLDLSELYKVLSPCIELADGDMVQMIALDKNCVYLSDILKAIEHELNTSKCEGIQIVFPLFDDNQFVAVDENFILANVVYMWG